MKIQFDKFIFICFLSLFLPAFFIPLGLLVPLYLLACIVITGYYLCFHFYKSKMFVNDVMNKTPFKYFICFILWIILDLLFLVIIGNVSLIKAISAIVIILVGYFILYYLTPLLVCQRLIKKRQLYKIIVTAIYIIFLWGIIAHIAVLYNIHSIQIVQSVISNRQFLSTGKIYTLDKARSVFFEAGFFGYFICLNIPLICIVKRSRYRIFHNKYINFIIKRTILPLALINLFITRSPINWFFAVVILLILAIRRSLNNKRNFISKLIIISLLLICSFQLYPKIKNYGPISRIDIVINAILEKNINLLLNLEPSLGTRVVSYVNSFMLFTQHPILGVGLDQGKFIMYKQMEKSPLSLTPELIQLQQIGYSTGKMIFNQNILCWALSELGFIGFFLFYLYLFKSLVSLNKATKYLYGIDKEFAFAIKNTLITIICLSFYEMSIVQAPYHFLIFSISNLIVYNTLNKKLLLQNKMEEIQNE